MKLVGARYKGEPLLIGALRTEKGDKYLNRRRSVVFYKAELDNLEIPDDKLLDVTDLKLKAWENPGLDEKDISETDGLGYFVGNWVKEVF